MTKKIINLTINLINFLLKGFFFVFGAKFLEVEDLGKIGIFFSYISISVFILGLEYWYFSNRKISSVYYKKRYKLLEIYIYNQFYFSAVWFFIISIPIYFIFHNSFSNINFLLIMVSIYSFYLIQDISRFLIYMDKQILSSFATLSLSLWTLPIYLFWLINKNVSYIEIISVYVLSLFTFAIIWYLIFFKIANLNISNFINFHKYLNFSLQKKAINLSSVMLLSVISYKLSELSPRIYTDIMKDYKTAGIVTFYQSFSLLSIGLIYYFVSVFFVPTLIKEKDNTQNFKKIAKKFKRNLIIFSFIFFTISSFIPWVFIRLLKIHEEYLNYYYFFLILNFCYMLINISNYYSNVAYAKNIDKVAYMTNFFSFLAVTLSYIILSIIEIKIINIIIISFIAFSVIQFLLKRYLLYKYLKEEI